MAFLFEIVCLPYRLGRMAPLCWRETVRGSCIKMVVGLCHGRLNCDKNRFQQWSRIFGLSTVSDVDKGDLLVVAWGFHCLWSYGIEVCLGRRHIRKMAYSS